MVYIYLQHGNWMQIRKSSFQGFQVKTLRKYNKKKQQKMNCWGLPGYL